MSNVVSRSVADLPADSRQSLEQLVGSPLLSHQRVYIIVDAPPTGPAPSVRLAAAQRIREIMDSAQAHADAAGVADAEIDAAVEQAMAHIRPRV